MTMRPFMIEFSGTPEAGKTTTIKFLLPMLRKKGYKVCFIPESAEEIPQHMPKNNWYSNYWMRTLTLNRILSSIYDDFDIILIDRGLLDSLFWGYLFYARKQCSFEQLQSYFSAFSMEDLYPDLTISLISDPSESIIRRGGEGRVVTLDFIKEYNRLFRSFHDSLYQPKIMIDTTNQSKQKVVQLAYDFFQVIHDRPPN